MTPGQRVMDAIKRKHLSQRTVSTALNIPYSTLNGWKNGDRNPSCEYIIPICEYLDVTPQYILTGEEGTKADFSLTSDEKKLVSSYRRLPENMQSKLLGYAGGMCDTYLDSLNEKRSYESKIS